MTDMLTAKDLQDLLQVDRSTIYRMAEQGRLPAVKVGRQWRFPGDQIEMWLQTQHSLPAVDLAPVVEPDLSLHDLPLDCVQLIQDAFADALGVMLVVTDMAGEPITSISNPTDFYRLLDETGHGHQLCLEKWQELSQTPALEPRLSPGAAGLLCGRAFVRLGNSLQGMVIVFGLAAADWPPSAATIADVAAELGVAPDRLADTLATAPRPDPAARQRILHTLQRIADVLAHIGSERITLMAELRAELTRSLER